MTWRKTAKGKQADAFEELVKEKLVAPQQKVRTANVNKLRALHADIVTAWKDFDRFYTKKMDGVTEETHKDGESALESVTVLMAEACILEALLFIPGDKEALSHPKTVAVETLKVPVQSMLPQIVAMVEGSSGSGKGAATREKTGGKETPRERRTRQLVRGRKEEAKRKGDTKEATKGGKAKTKDPKAKKAVTKA